MNDKESSGEEVVTFNLSFALDEDEKTASIVGNENAKGNILIPITFENEDIEYTVTKISKGSFENTEIKSVKIPIYSKLKTIEEEAFSNSTIQSLELSPSVIELKDGWCLNTPRLTKIMIPPNNPRYIYFDDKIIVGKSDINSNDYDDLIFARRDIRSVVIPSFIKRISPYSFSESRIEKVFISPSIQQICEGAFYRCSHLEQVEISPYSKLEKIEKHAFFDTSIKSINLPLIHGLNLEEDWCPSSVVVTKKTDETTPIEKVAEKKVLNENELISSLQCPVCYLLMNPPERTPMMIPGCGHSFCSNCIKKLKECPLCHQKITVPVKNILAIQLIESIDKGVSIPYDIKPPPPFENKLIPEIRPICTYYLNNNNLKQKFYGCDTCQIPAVCEICAKECHKGHKGHLSDSYFAFCICCTSGKCNCYPNNSDVCTFDLTYGTPVEQPMYQCEDCNIINDLYLCQNCAIHCHEQHKLKYVGLMKDKICHCFDQCNCKITERKPICTFAHTGQNYEKQPYYHCYTCGLTNNLGCCSACAHNCHKGHDVRFAQFSDKFFCDCGKGSHGIHCSILNNFNSSYLTSCPNFLQENKDKKIEQRKYICKTCGINLPFGICEGCAINCHINHMIEYVGVEKFCCSCKSNEKCKIAMNPLLHNNRSQCDRLTLTKDDVSACYTCNTCDKTGAIEICETCALKNHLHHDIHLLGYLKFGCHG